MKKDEIRKTELNEAELEQISGGETPVIVVHPALHWYCPQCGYSIIIGFGVSDRTECPHCHVPLAIS